MPKRCNVFETRGLVKSQLTTHPSQCFQLLLAHSMLIVCINAEYRWQHKFGLHLLQAVEYLDVHSSAGLTVWANNHSHNARWQKM